MKTILCYGDSNTYGYNPVTGGRWPEDIRWTGRLQQLLGNKYKVIEEGCNGRTTIYKAPGEGSLAPGKARRLRVPPSPSE